PTGEAAVGHSTGPAPRRAGPVLPRLRLMPKITNDGLRKRCGCAKRTWAKCSHPWHVNFHHDGREYRFSLDVVAKQRCQRPPTTKGQAQTWRDRLRSEIREKTFTTP